MFPRKSFTSFASSIKRFGLALALGTLFWRDFRAILGTFNCHVPTQDLIEACSRDFVRSVDRGPSARRRP